ncbi:MAG: indole-3-glycerol phosphate synthase TrpC [Dehalococcoidales bacterium]
MFLEEIVHRNQEELQARKKQLPLAEVCRLAKAQPPPLDLAAALRGDGVRLIAEVKKASPSRGVIRQDFNPVAIAGAYAAGGAAAISVLTEVHYFQGSLEYLKDIRTALGENRPPLLRKDFIFDPYQVYESLAYGADSLLLIAAILTPEMLVDLCALSHELGLSCLVEVHNESDLVTALESGAGIIGINNRDLNTFTVDLATTERLRPLIPADRIVISESGIGNRDDVDNLKRLGVDALLIGEALMAASDIAAKMRELL